jgi:hypothetical protein
VVPQDQVGKQVGQDLLVRLEHPRVQQHMLLKRGTPCQVHLLLLMLQVIK